MSSHASHCLPTGLFTPATDGVVTVLPTVPCAGCDHTLICDFLGWNWKVLLPTPLTRSTPAPPPAPRTGSQSVPASPPPLRCGSPPRPPTPPARRCLTVRAREPRGRHVHQNPIPFKAWGQAHSPGPTAPLLQTRPPGARGGCAVLSERVWFLGTHPRGGAAGSSVRPVVRPVTPRRRHARRPQFTASPFLHDPKFVSFLVIWVNRLYE